MAQRNASGLIVKIPQVGLGSGVSLKLGRHVDLDVVRPVALWVRRLLRARRLALARLRKVANAAQPLADQFFEVGQSAGTGVKMLLDKLDRQPAVNGMANVVRIGVKREGHLVSL